MFSYSHTTLHLLTHNPTPTYTQPYTYSHTTLHLLTQPTHTQKPTPYFSIFTLILLPYIHHYHSIHPPAHIYHHYYPRNILFPYYLLIFFPYKYYTMTKKHTLKNKNKNKITKKYKNSENKAKLFRKITSKKLLKHKKKGGFPFIILSALKTILALTGKGALFSGKIGIALAKHIISNPITSATALGMKVLIIDNKKYFIPLCYLWEYLYNIKLNPPIFNWERNAPYDFYSKIKPLFKKESSNEVKSYKESFDKFISTFLLSFEEIINSNNDDILRLFSYDGDINKNYFKVKILHLLKKHNYEFSDFEQILDDNKKLVYKNDKNNETVPQRLFNLILHEFDGMTCDINTPTIIYNMDNIGKKIDNIIHGTLNDDITDKKFFTNINANYKNTGFNCIYNESKSSFIYNLKYLKDVFESKIDIYIDGNEHTTNEYRIKDLIRHALDKSNN